MPWVSAKDMKTFRLNDAEDHLTSEGVANGTRIAPPGSTLVLVRGMTLHDDVPVCLAMRDMAFNQDVKALLPQPNVDGDFLVYWLLSNKPTLLGLVDAASHGTGRLNTDSLKALELHLPSLDVQREIAGVLSALDDKIDLNRRMNETLEATARAIFKSWFIDFDPVRGTAPVPEDIRRLFPVRLVDSPLGPMPEGWEVAPLTGLMTVNRESVDPRNHPQELFDHYSLPAFDAGRVPACDRGADIKSSKLQVADGCVLLSKLNPRIPRVWWPSSSGRLRRIASTEFVVALPRDYFTRSYLFGLFTSAKFRSTLMSLVRGTSGSHQRVSATDLLDVEVSLPPRPLIDQFDAIVAPMFDQQEALTAESKTLAELRDTLLPKLISGEITVGGASPPTDFS
jgi:type I restriction enzyme S subunit